MRRPIALHWVQLLAGPVWGGLAFLLPTAMVVGSLLALPLLALLHFLRRGRLPAGRIVRGWLPASMAWMVVVLVGGHGQPPILAVAGLCLAVALPLLVSLGYCLVVAPQEPSREEAPP